MKRCRIDAGCKLNDIKACAKICIKATNSEYNKEKSLR